MWVDGTLVVDPARTAARIATAGIPVATDVCVCPEDHPFGVPVSTAGDPWLNTFGFLGVLPVSWSEEHPVVRDGGSDRTAGFGVPGRVWIEFELLLVASNPQGLMWGQDWFTRVFRTECCGGSSLAVTRWCDPAWTAGAIPGGRWEYHGVTVTEVEWLEPDTPVEGRCARRVRIVFETRLRCVTPTVPTQVVSIAGPWDTPVECWVCPDCPPAPSCDDFGCDALLPVYPNTIPVAGGWTQPLEIVRKTVFVPAATPTLVPRVTLSGGSTPTLNAQIRVLPDLGGVDPAADWTVYECVEPLQHGRVCEVPTFGQVVFDGTTQQATLDSNVFAAQRVVDCRETGWEWEPGWCDLAGWTGGRWLVVEVNPQTTPASFAVTVELFDTRCGVFG